MTKKEKEAYKTAVKNSIENRSLGALQYELTTAAMLVQVFVDEINYLHTEIKLLEDAFKKIAAVKHLFFSDYSKKVLHRLKDLREKEKR